ncbi:MAG: DUF445 family protein [Deltaproteobacteria bacterium]|nr:DUF445 family protein [Deltaproteobacteria bacterium]
MTEYYPYILPPIVGAFIGWLTNFIAIKLLFRPLIPLNIFGYELQGLIPKRRKDIARGIAKAIENELLSSKDLAAALNSIDWKEDIEKAVEEVVEHRLSSSKVKSIPVIGLVAENLSYHVKYLIAKDILAKMEEKKGDLARKVAGNIDVKGMLATKIDALDLTRFEGLLTEFIARELRHIEWLGGVMGFLIGVFQAVIFYLTR